MDKQFIIEEIKRVANGAEALSQGTFEEKSAISLSAVRYYFGTWNQAVQAAGLLPNLSGGRGVVNRIKVSDDEYLQEIVRLTGEIGRKVTEAEMNAKGRFSIKPYRDRWGTFSHAREAAYEKFGSPIISVQP